MHYLMKTDPPVLQKLESGLERIRTLDNKQTVGELWVGFLNYYAYEFDWKKNVVCIRKLAEPLTREEKKWTNHCLAIEDPYELDRNLAKGVTAKKSLYILKCFAKARSIFGMCKVGFKPDETQLNVHYFFDLQSLVDGPPPMDNNCYFCFKIGHHIKKIFA